MAKNFKYEQAGVNMNAGYETLKLIKPLINKTKTNSVIGEIGGFAGLFSVDFSKHQNPIFVSSTDGVGTKTEIAKLLNINSTIGIDCVAMCVNDIICCGAKPLFFLDYVSCGKNHPEKIKQIVSGIANGCIQAEMALIGGETAEHPGLMKENEFDLAGFCVGIVEKEKILPKKNLNPKDLIIAIPSSGVHSNGFSLIRKIFNINESTNFNEKFGCLNKTLGETLLEPTKIYVKPILNLLNKVEVKALSHITGGGFFENVPRVLTKNVDAVIEISKIKPPEIFNLIKKIGKLETEELFSIFNMGVGMIAIVDEENFDLAIKTLKNDGIDAFLIGSLQNGSGNVKLI